MTPADLIKEARSKKEWTQKQLADAVGVTASFITKVEAGESYPSYERCFSLANVLGLSPDKLWAQVEKSQTMTFQQRIRTRGKAVRTALGGVMPRSTGDVLSAKEISAEDIARDLSADAELLEAYRNLRIALANPQMRETILNTLRTFAAQASHSED